MKNKRMAFKAVNDLVKRFTWLIDASVFNIGGGMTVFLQDEHEL